MPETTSLPCDPALAFTELLERHRGIVFKVAASYSYTAEDRADLAQEIATQLWRAFPDYDLERPFSTWMYRIALNVAIGQLRGRRRGKTEPLGEDAEAVPDPHPHDPERELQLRALQRFIAALPPLERALMLLYLDERPQREIAEVLGISETNVSTRINRLKRRIRDEL